MQVLFQYASDTVKEQIIKGMTKVYEREMAYEQDIIGLDSLYHSERNQIVFIEQYSFDPWLVDGL